MLSAVFIRCFAVILIFYARPSNLQSLPKVLGIPFDCSILCDNYEIPVKHNGLRPPTPQNKVEMTVVLDDSCAKAI